MTSPWDGPGSVMECLTETMERYKGRIDPREFRQPLEKRKKVRFAVVIRRPLETNRMIVPEEKARVPQQAKAQAKAPVKKKQSARPAKRPISQSAHIRRAHERARTRTEEPALAAGPA